MAKRGVSAEEKKIRLLSLFHEKGECFQLKELEKLAVTEKGIRANCVKEIVTQLADEELVDSDKIGTSVYYWSFPSKALQIRKRKLDELQSQHEQAQKKLKLVEECLANASNTEEEERQWKAIMDEIGDLDVELCNSKMSLKHYEDNDPEKYKQITQKTQVLKDAVNRWTDNIFAVKSWCKKKFFMEDSTLNKQFGIPEDLDYI